MYCFFNLYAHMYTYTLEFRLYLPAIIIIHAAKKKNKK